LDLSLSGDSKAKIITGMRHRRKLEPRRAVGALRRAIDGLHIPTCVISIPQLL